MTNLSFFAQSLDNKSRDIIIQNGGELYNDESRRKLVFEISEVRSEKREIPGSSSLVTVRYSDPKFVMEVIPVEKDESNRLAPIVIYGEFPEECSSNWVNNVCNEIQEVVSNQIKRTLQNGTLELIKKWLNEKLEAKKKKVYLQKQIIGLATSCLVPLLVAWIIQMQGWQLKTLQIGGLIGLNNLLVISLQIFLINPNQSKFNLK